MVRTVFGILSLFVLGCSKCHHDGLAPWHGAVGWGFWILVRLLVVVLNWDDYIKLNIKHTLRLCIAEDLLLLLRYLAKILLFQYI